ncbi:GNAT family N-acetyltransferase [Microvirga sp. STR05]|uniref:GNAT family N-acetyltransferase n=1 Tax=Hymenobacter duratus TaxID=2771356 RepID=A0ABR8JEG5_9BACT|nr:GNAT family N-acetyltransferase [Hymenobacter duratus]MBD2713770.1 GNAT family N-acetyltransferase [Hymenobacter duratus]MBR7948672.1 GNAT family N-acetyltransferase [Microvirga sp. STR05]
MTIRRGREADLPQVLALIQELAEYEKAPHEVTNTLADMQRDGFGPEPIFSFFVAEDAACVIIGIALYYTAYSTWKGRMLFLEDLVVTEAQRGTGLGRKLFDAVVAEARRTGAHRLKWQVLEWNEPAIGFYRKLGANLDPEWHNGNLSSEQLQAYPCDPVVEAVVKADSHS